MKRETLNEIIDRLDLTDHIGSLTSLFAREKSIVMGGNIAEHYRFITSLEGVELPQLPEMPNLDDEIFKLSKEGILDLDTIYKFVQQVQLFNRLKRMTLPDIWREFVSSIEIPDEVIEVVKYFNDKGELEPALVPKLQEVKSAIENIRVQKRELLRNLATSSRLSQFLVDSQVHLYYGQESLLVRGGFSKVIDANIIGRSSSGFFYIVPRSLDRLKAKESELLDIEQEIYSQYAREFSKTLHKWSRFLKFLNRTFDRVDHYFSRALFARKGDFNLILPKKWSKKVILRDFKHPAIKGAKPISIDFKNRIMLVTGVNAGGKTMLLKSILGSVLMAKHLIPFSLNPHHSEISNFRETIAILDDPQSVKNDISTFAGRMVEFKKLFRVKNALVGVDEIELGTDADEAAALFRSILEELIKRDIYFIVTTHHKRLASIMASKRYVDLVAALYDEKRQAPTYTYLHGTIGKSYAFETALRYGIDKRVVDRAKKYLGEDKEQLNRLIERSTELEIEMKQKIEDAQKRLESAKERERKLEELKERLVKEQQEKLSELERSYQNSLKLLKDALKEVENSEARRLMGQAHKGRKGVKVDSLPKKLVEPEIGKVVRYRDKKGQIISIRGKDVYILTDDGIKMRVAINSLEEVVEVKKIKSPKRKVEINVSKPQNSKIVLKVLGKRADEAIEEVQDFISDALIHGFNEVEIIHGTGSGVLAKVITQLLKSHPKVKSFERAKGNLGVTVVKL